MQEALIIYTDGSARGNGRKDAQGGFGVVVCDGWQAKEENYRLLQVYQEQESGTTNNRMEMKAILWALENFGNPGSHVVRSPSGEELMATSLTPIVYSDSAYAVNTFTNWIHGWKRNGWVRAHNKPIENLDLVKKWDELTGKGYRIELRHCTGHSGNKWNELADGLATGRFKVNELENEMLGGNSSGRESKII